MSASTKEIENLIGREYKQGFITNLETDSFPPGLDEDVIRKLSLIKKEPEFSTCLKTLRFKSAPGLKLNRLIWLV